MGLDNLVKEVMKHPDVALVAAGFVVLIVKGLYDGYKLAEDAKQKIKNNNIIEYDFKNDTKRVRERTTYDLTR